MMEEPCLRSKAGTNRPRPWSQAREDIEDSTYGRQLSKVVYTVALFVLWIGAVYLAIDGSLKGLHKLWADESTHLPSCTPDNEVRNALIFQLD
jgi:hypothetical protein